MPVMTEARYQRQILVDVDDTENVVAPAMPDIWDAAANMGTGYLQYLYARRHAALVYRAFVKKQVDFAEAGNLDVKRHQQLTALEKIYTDTTVEIADYRAQASNGATPLVGTLTTVAPIPSPLYGPDANDPRYTGDPNQVPGRVQS